MPNTPPRPAGVPVSGMLTANQSPKVRHATPAGVHVPVSAGTYAPFTRATQSSRGHSPSTSSNAGFPPFQQRHQSYAPVPAYQHNPGSGYLIPYHSQSVTPVSSETPLRERYPDLGPYVAAPATSGRGFWSFRWLPFGNLLWATNTNACTICALSRSSVRHGSYHPIPHPIPSSVSVRHAGRCL